MWWPLGGTDEAKQILTLVRYLCEDRLGTDLGVSWLGTTAGRVCGNREAPRALASSVYIFEFIESVCLVWVSGERGQGGRVCLVDLRTATEVER